MVSTMDWSELLLPISQAEYLVTCPEREMKRFVATMPETGGVVRILRGERCQTPADLFREIGWALELPDECRPDWESLRDCLLDVELLTASGYALILTHVDRLLHESADDFARFLAILQDVIARRNAEAKRLLHTPDEGAPFHVVFHCERDRRHDAIARLQAVGVDPTVAVPWLPERELANAR